jgi:hypothetical protein
MHEDLLFSRGRGSRGSTSAETTKEQNAMRISAASKPHACDGVAPLVRSRNAIWSKVITRCRGHFICAAS